MTQHEQQGNEPIFQLDNKYVVKGWEKVNPKSKKPSVPIEKVELFLKYVFEESKDELEMDLDEDADYMQMVLDFLEEHEISDKKDFTLEEALDILNWAVDPGNLEEEGGEGSEQQHQQPKKQKEVRPQLKKQSQESLTQQKEHKEPEKPQKHEENQQNQDEKSKQVTQFQKLEEQKQQQKQSAHQIHVSKHEPSEKHEHQEPQRQEPQHQQHLQPSHQQHKKSHHQQPQTHQDHHDWGKDDSYEEMSQKLYKEINSYQQKSPNDNMPFNKMFMNQVSFNESQQVPEPEENDNPRPTQTSKKYYKQPMSIKKSLAQLSKSKVHKKSKDLPVLKLEPTAPEMRYLKKQKIVLKNKKPKPEYHPQLTGLQEMFKFYCGLNSEFYSMSKHKDPAKGTFDEFQSRMNNLYMHNFMLLCKDFSISESKMNAKAGMKPLPKDHIKENLGQSKSTDPKTEMPVKRKSSKGLVPETIQVSAQMNKSGVQVEIGQKQKQQPKGKKQKMEVKKDIWDRDRLSNYFKRQADYTLNVKYDKFIQIMKTVLKDKLVIQEEKPQQQVKPQPVAQRQSPKEQSPKNQVQAKRKLSQADKEEEEEEEEEEEASQAQISEAEKAEQHDEEEPQQEQQPKEQKQPVKNEEPKPQALKIDPVIMAICKFFKLDSEQNYESTMAKLRAQYKINSPLATPKTQQPKKPLTQQQQHSQFQQDVNDALKMRQLEKQQQRIQIKEKYFNKYSVPQVDVYSSFKGATSHVNSLNSLYGSAPKLIPNKQGKCSTVSEGTFGASTFDYDMRKKHSGEYKVNMASIIKDARNQIINTGKQNKHSNRVKEHFNTQILAKSRLNGLNSAQNSPKPTLGYKKLHDLRQLKEQEETLSSILLNNSRLIDGGNTSRSQKTKIKSKDISSPLLQRMGCHEEDDLLNKYFDQEKILEKSNVKLATNLR